MRVHAIAVLAALVSCAAPLTDAAARPVEPARPGAYSVELTDELGNVLPTWSHQGRTYVLGSLGQRYFVRVRNHSGRRAEIVVSVDGRDVLDGRAGLLDEARLPRRCGRRGGDRRIPD